MAASDEISGTSLAITTAGKQQKIRKKIHIYFLINSYFLLSHHIKNKDGMQRKMAAKTAR